MRIRWTPPGEVSYRTICRAVFDPDETESLQPAAAYWSSVAPVALFLLFLTGLGAGREADSALAHFAKGTELMRGERYEEASSEFAEAVRDDPSLTEAQLKLAICDFELRRYENADNLFQKLADKNPVATYYLGRIDIAQARLPRAIERFETIERAGGVEDSKFYLATAYYRDGQLPKAIPLLRAWIAQNPRDFRAHELLARSLAKTGTAAESEREFTKTRELHGYYSSTSVTIHRCSWLLSEGRHTEAWETCRPLLDTDDVDKLAAIGIIFGKAGDNDHGQLIWEKAARLDPESPEINYNLALAKFQLKDLPGSRTYAQKALKLWPDFPEANVLYGTVLYMLADDAHAFEILSRAQRLRPDDQTVRRLLSELQVHSTPR